MSNKWNLFLDVSTEHSVILNYAKLRKKVKKGKKREDIFSDHKVLTLPFDVNNEK